MTYATPLPLRLRALPFADTDDVIDCRHASIAGGIASGIYTTTRHHYGKQCRRRHADVSSSISSQGHNNMTLYDIRRYQSHLSPQSRAATSIMSRHQQMNVSQVTPHTIRQPRIMAVTPYGVCTPDDSHAFLLLPSFLATHTPPHAIGYAGNGSCQFFTS